MELDYFNYRFYRPQRRLLYLGAWPPEAVSDKLWKRIWYLYLLVFQSMNIFNMSDQLYHLYMSLWDLRKMTFNFCSSTIVMGIFGKMLLLYTRRDKLRSLHCELWKDSMKYDSAEDAAQLNFAYNKLIWIRKLMFTGPYIVIPIWGAASYFSYKWGPRVLPFAGYFGEIDYNVDAIYLPLLIYEVIMAFFVIITVLESDLSMLAIVFQVEAHCKILRRNLIRLIQSFVGDENGLAENKCKGEVNEYLRHKNLVKKLGELVKRHLELLRYCTDIEYVFNGSMAIQLILGSFVILMNGVETIRHVSGLNITLLHQMMYICFLVADIYIICHYFTTLAAEHTKIGQAAYDSCWYKMDTRVKRTLCLIITRAQRPPKFTYGKLFIINLRAFMLLIKNIYSWLMLLRQLEIKQ